MNAPVANAETALAVIDPKAYAAWDPLLDLFDSIRVATPVLRIESPSGDHDPFWLITRHHDVMRISKDNVTFLNAPRPSVFTNKAGEALARSITGGSPNLVQSLVSLDAPKHPKLRRLTQEWFMPKNLRLIEADIRALAKNAPSINWSRQVQRPILCLWSPHPIRCMW
jgi:cytochrome P450